MSDPGGESNIDEVEAWIDGVVDAFDFTRPGEDQSLGRDMAGDVAAGIQERTVAEQRDATGGPLKPNKDPYKTWKEVKLGVYQPLIKTGQMLSLASLKGEVDVTPGEVVMRYGTGEPPSSTSSPKGGLSDADKAVTDRQKADWVSGERPFYAMDDAIVESVARRAQEELDKVIRERS